MKILCLLMLAVLIKIKAEQSSLHPVKRHLQINFDGGENTTSYWYNIAQTILKEKLAQTTNTNVAKNIILFLGDGMSIPTLKAARIYQGQLVNATGIEQEQEELAFQKFAHVGLSKTYCIDVQVPDSACTATAYHGGVKARCSTIGVTGDVLLNDCEASLVEENHVASIAAWSQLNNKKTGLITTARVTHASPAGVYAHTANRNWEDDSSDVPSNCTDIAYQLVHGEVGKKLNVIMGGGRKYFLPSTITDEEGTEGTRLDGNNLIENWLDDRNSLNAKYIWNRSELLALNSETEYVLGLFDADHMQYHLEADENEPTLEEMVESALNVLDNDEGFFLFVEGGRIDHAHHDNYAKKALDETVEFSKAIQKACDMTNEKDTLIVVTSDHAHVMTVSGYPEIGNDILGTADTASDGYPYLTLGYANGPGYKADVDGHRYDTTNDDTHDNSYRFPTQYSLGSETHGGDDVGIFANGPWAHLFTGVIEQNAIPHLMAYAACVGNGVTACNSNTN